MTKRDIEYNVPLRLPIPGEDTEAMFRRLVAFSYAVGRQYRADGGPAEEPGAEASRFVREELARPSEAEQAQIREITRPSPLLDQYGGYGAREAVQQNVSRPMPTAHEFVQHQLKGNEPQLPQMDREAYQRMKEYSVLPLELAAYEIPVAGQALAAVDLARSIGGLGSALRTGDKADVAGSAAEAGMAASGTRGKLAKMAAAAMAGLMPEEAEAGTVGKALRAIREHSGSPEAKLNENIAKEITDYFHTLLAENPEAYHGLRITPSPLIEGKKAPPSRQWYGDFISDDHEVFGREAFPDHGRELPGPSVIGVQKPEDIERALKYAGLGSKPFHQGYFGDNVSVISGGERIYGEDPHEWILPEGVVLKSWAKKSSYAAGGEVDREDFDRGGSIIKAAIKKIMDYKDPASKYIKEWNWRPLAEVQKDIGTSEVPEHVQNFGRYMGEMSSKAATEGLDPEDVIKAYMITRSSIQREGRTPQKIASYGIPVRAGAEDLIRPEGHMADFLSSPMGVRFLNEARKGNISQDTVDAAVSTMRPFGLSKVEPDAMDWARRNLPERASEVSDLVARAKEGASTPDEWRDFTRAVRGVGPAKTGFLGSLLGRGDLPTLDARQAILHTGMKNAEAQDIMARNAGRAGHEAVDRLAARQRALDFQLPEDLDPFYQHLAHHTVWDAIGKEKTTHQDIIDAMKPRASGGEVEREGFDKGGPIIRSVINKALRAAEEAGRRIPVERAREMIASPFSENPESIKAALKYAESLRVPQGEERIPGSFYNVKQTRPVSEVTSTITDIPGVRALDPREMSWEDVLRKYKGATMFNVAGDRSNLGRMTHINERELAWPVDLHAGPKYMLEPNEGAIWANNPAHATGFQKAIREAAQRGPVIGAYHPMGVQSVDSSHNMIDALLAQIGRGDIGKKEMKGADDLLRKGAQAEKEKIELAVEAMRGWPGFSNAREASEFARSLEGTRRAEIVKFLDKAPLLKQGFPAVGETRVAITDPALRDVSGNMLGHRIVEFDPDTLTPTGSLAFQHSTYTSPTAGRYVGDVPLVQTQYAMPDVERDIMTKLAKGDRVVHPYSYDPLGRSSWRKSFETRKLGQEVNQEMLDSIMQGLERQNKYGLADGGEVDGYADGYADGGSVIKDALDVVYGLPRAAEAETSA